MNIETLTGVSWSRWSPQSAMCMLKGAVRNVGRIWQDDRTDIRIAIWNVVRIRRDDSTDLPIAILLNCIFLILVLVLLV